MPDSTSQSSASPSPGDGAARPAPRGNVKLVGIAGLVKGEQFSIEAGKSVVIGRSRECDICLRDIPAAKEIDQRGGDADQHFRTVSRKHMRLTCHAPDNVELEDLSANGLFLDGKRIEGRATVSDLQSQPHELKLGTTETFQLDWWRVPARNDAPMVKVVMRKADSKPGENPA